MVKLAPVLAFLVACPALAVDEGVSGLWYNPVQPGHGFTVNVLGANSAAVAWYTYDANGYATWVSGLLTETAPGVLTGNANYTQGMRFQTFAPAPATFPWGTLKVTFSGCDTATVEYNGTLRFQDGSGFGAGTVPIKKLAGVFGTNCGGQPVSVAGLYAGAGRLVGRPETDELYALLEPDGTATVLIPDEAALTGTYTVSGSRLNMTLTGQTVGGAVFANGATTASFAGSADFRAQDYVGGTASGGSAGSVEFALVYAGLGTRTASAAAVTGRYRDSSGFVVNIAASGAFSGTDTTGCAVAGNITPKSNGLNAYATSATVTNCGPANGQYLGTSVVYDSDRIGDGRGLAVALRGPLVALASTFRRD